MAAQDKNEMTMWSESMLEALFLTLRKGKDDNKVKQVLRELLGKGYKRPFIVEQVRQELGDNAAATVEGIFKGSGSKASGDRKPVAASQRRKPRSRPGASVYRKGNVAGDEAGPLGLVSWLRRLFGK